MENERLMLKQLLANIERNRVKWRKEIFEAESLSIQRRMALQSVKDKLDKQAIQLEEEQADLKEKCSKLRKQEEVLKLLKEKLDKLQRGTDNSEKKELQLREVRIEFDRYLRTYVAGARPKRGKVSMKATQEEKIQSFKQKWAAYLVNEHEKDDDLRPMLGLDAYDDGPKPYKLFSHHEVSSVLHRNKVGYNLMFDREIDKLRSNRDKVTGFLRDQQRWLANFKADLDHGLVPAARSSNLGAAVALSGGVNFYP